MRVPNSRLVLRLTLPALVVGLLGAAPRPAAAQGSRPVDLAGMWASRNGEDAPYRGPGGFLGDYTGLPINAASRQMASSWDADAHSQPERSTQAHPVQYSMRGEGPNMRINEIRDPNTDALVALTAFLAGGAAGLPIPHLDWLMRRSWARSAGSGRA